MGATPPRTAAAAPPIGGNCNIRGATRRRYAASQLLMLQTPTATSVERAAGAEGQDGAPVGGESPATAHTIRCHGETNLAQHEPHGPTSGTKLSQHTPSHRMCGTKLSLHAPSHRLCGTKLSLHARPRRISGIKLSLLTRNGSIWRFFDMQGEFCTVVTIKKPSRENFVPNARQRRGSPTQEHTGPHLCGGCRRDRCGGCRRDRCGGCRRDRCGGCRRDRCGGHRRDRRARAGFEAQSLAAVPVGGGGARPQYPQTTATPRPDKFRT